MTEQTSSAKAISVKEMVQGMSSIQKDQFFRVLNELQMRGSAQRLQTLRGELSRLKKQLSEIEQDRNQKKAWQGDLRDVKDHVSKTVDEGGDPQLGQLSYILLNLYSEAEHAVAHSKPQDLLARKAEIKKQIAAVERLASIASNIGAEVKGGD